MRAHHKNMLIPVAILLTATLLAVGLWLTRPEPKRTSIAQKPLLVNAASVVKQDLAISVQTQGTVTPRTTTTIVAEVPGSIIRVSPRFKAGGFFKKGETLLQIDQRDYLTQVKRARAAVASASSALATEKGRAEVAYQDWIKYKSNVTRSQAATDLALRKPQLADAKARLDAATADLQHARNELERTTIRAPYDGLVRSKNVDIGQYVTEGATLAQTFAIDVAEIRLALPENKLAYLQLPALTNNNRIQPDVQLSVKTADQHFHWHAKLVRTEGVFDERSRVLFAVAQIDDPYGLQSGKQALRMGTFVNASIKGKVMSGLVKLPRFILRTGNRLWVIDSQQRLQNRRVSILNTQGDDIYVTDGLTEGELVSLSNASGAIAGTKVRIASTIASNEEKKTPADSAPLTPPEKHVDVAPASSGPATDDKTPEKSHARDQTA